MKNKCLQCGKDFNDQVRRSKCSACRSIKSFCTKCGKDHRNGVRDDNRPENLELWTTSHPSGQRVSDKVAWAKEILRTYKEGEEMISRVKSGEKCLNTCDDGGYCKKQADEDGILVVPDAKDFYGVLITDSQLRELGYQRIPEAPVEPPPLPEPPPIEYLILCA